MKQLLYLLTAVLLLSACQKSDFSGDHPAIPEGMGELIPGQLLISSELFPETQEPEASRATRATATSALPDGATLRLYAFKKGETDFGTKLATRTYTVDAAGVPQLDAGQEPLYLPAGEVDVYLAGPVSVDIGTVDNPQVEEIAGAYGIYPRVGVDLIAAYASSTVTVGLSNPLPAMTLTHKMARVQVVVEAAENAVFENLALQEIKLFEQPLTGSYTLNNDGGVVVPSASAAEFVYPLITEETAKIKFSATTVLIPQPSKEFKIETTFECNQKNTEVTDNHPTLRYRQSGFVQEPLAAATATRFTARPMIPVEIKWRTKVLPWNSVAQDGITIPTGVELTVPTTPPTADQYVEINGLKWTKGNLVAKNTHQCMVGDPGDYGVYFQFGSLVGWTGGADGNGTGQGSPTVDQRVWPIELGVNKPTYRWQNNNAANISKLNNYYFNYTANGWDVGGKDVRNFAEPIDGDAGTGTLASGRYAKFGVGDPCTYYLGEPWRLPTGAEFQALFDHVGNMTSWPSVRNWSWITSSYSGAQHQSKPLYFPASGSRHYSIGSFVSATDVGFYWSSSVSSVVQGASLYVNSVNVFPDFFGNRSYGYPVRCVSGTYVKPNPVNPPTASDYVEIDGLRWAKGNLVASSSTASNTNGCKVGAPADGGLYFQFGSLIGWKGGATANGGTGVGANPNTGTGSQWWGGSGNPGANIFATDAMVWPALMASTPAAWSPDATQATEANAFKKWYFDFSGTSGGVNYSTAMSDIRSYTHPTLGALKEGKMASLGVGDPCTYYLGDPWRLPTAAEFKALFDNANEGGAYWPTANWNGVTTPYNGAQHQSKPLYFPASGTRIHSNGSFLSVTQSGSYWSSSVKEAGYGYSVTFTSSIVYTQYSSSPNAKGYPVRCVSTAP